MTGQYGVKETLDVVEFGIKVSQGVHASMADGQWNGADIVNFGPAVMALFPAIENVGQIRMELADLQPDEQEQIRAKVLELIPDLSEDWKVVATNAINAAIAIYNIVKVLIKK